MNETPWFVYLLQCRSGRIYTGVTPTLNQRMKAHKTKRGSLFTKMDPPVRLLAAKPFPTKGEALRIERQVKGVSAPHKLRLAELWLEQHPIDQIAQESFPLV